MYVWPLLVSSFLGIPYWRVNCVCSHKLMVIVNHLYLAVWLTIGGGEGAPSQLESYPDNPQALVRERERERERERATKQVANTCFSYFFWDLFVLCITIPLWLLDVSVKFVLGTMPVAMWSSRRSSLVWQSTEDWLTSLVVAHSKTYVHTCAYIHTHTCTCICMHIPTSISITSLTDIVCWCLFLTECLMTWC